MSQRRGDAGSGEQLRLDFDRAATLRIVEYIRLPKRIEVRFKRASKKRASKGEAEPTTATVSGNACGRVLGAIESLCGNAGDPKTATTKIETLATLAKVSPAVAARALMALEQLRLLAIEGRANQRGRLPSRYRPVWSNALDYVDRENWPKKFQAASDHGDSPSDHGDSASDHGDRTLTASSYRQLNRHPQTPSNEVAADPDWAVVVEFVEFGISLAEGLARIAQSRDYTASQIPELISHARTHANEWDNPAGVLYRRIERVAASMPTAEGWPPPSDRKVAGPDLDLVQDRNIWKRKLNALPAKQKQRLAEYVRDALGNRRAVAHFERFGDIDDTNADAFIRAHQELEAELCQE